MIRVLIADSNPSTREQMRSFVASDPELEILGLARDGHEALQLAHHHRPDVALLSADLAVHDGFQTAEYLEGVGYLPTQIIILSDIDTPEQLRRAMRAGAREHLARPVSRELVLSTIRQIYDEEQRRHTPSFAQAADPKNTCRLISVSGAKGGIGKTTIAANLAIGIAMETGEPTVLIDLYTQFGDVAMMLNLSPRKTIADLSTLDPEEVDEQMLDDCMMRHESGIRVLSGSTTPSAIDSLNVVCLENIFSILKINYRFIVVDVPPMLHTTTLYVISHATAALVVANLIDISTINDTRYLLNTLQGKYISKEKIKLVLNRVSRQNRLQVSDIEQTLGYPVEAQIPNDDVLVPNSVNQGVPFVLSQPTSPVAQSIRQLARSVAGVSGGDVMGSTAAFGGQPKRTGMFSG